VIAAFLGDRHAVRIVQIKVSSQLVSRRVAGIPTVALALFGAQEAHGHGSLPIYGVAQTLVFARVR
jgi:hypothetical protein